MRTRFMRICGLAFSIGLVCAGIASAGVPFPFFSTCTITITQFPTRTACITNFDPDVVRLTPAGAGADPPFDRVSIMVRVRDANNVVVSGASLSFSEQSGIVNIANGGASTAISDAEGLGTIRMDAASGYGRVALCADGVQLCNVQVRSPDVNKGSTPSLCGLSTSASAVTGSDLINPLCGFAAAFGPVTPGVNDGYDLNCDAVVNGSDINGSLAKGGVIQYFGDTGTLGSLNACP